MVSILRVDLRTLRSSLQPAPAAYDGLGGRCLTSRIVADEVPPRCDPLGPDNRLVFAPGLLGGTNASSSGRVSVGAKSPLTGGVKESNAGGMTATRLAQLGIMALVLEGAPSADAGPFVVVVRQVDGRPETEVLSSPALAGLPTTEAAADLATTFGPRAAFVINGPAGELLLKGAGIAHTDPEGRPCRYSARGGLGAVMGSKRVKAIVLQVERPRNRRAVDDAVWREAVREYGGLIRSSPGTERFSTLGTAAMMEAVHAMGALPHRNFGPAQFPEVEKVSGKRMREVILERDGAGTPTHACMPGCLIRCSNIYADSDGGFLVSPMEYETNVMLGPNLGIADLDTIARLNRQCNELGLDTIETGCALGVAMEAGSLSFGNGHAAAEALAGVLDGTDLGTALGNGTVATAELVGATRVPVVKGQGIAGYDPRGLKGNGVTYATSPMGADHTAGNAIGSPVDHLAAEGQVELSRSQQIKAAVLDSLGLCSFTKAVSLGNLPLVARLAGAMGGRPVSADDLLRAGRDTVLLEREFNRRAGMTEADDRLPQFFAVEPLAPHMTVWDVPDEDLDAMWKDE